MNGCSEVRMEVALRRGGGYLCPGRVRSLHGGGLSTVLIGTRGRARGAVPAAWWEHVACRADTATRDTVLPVLTHVTSLLLHLVPCRSHTHLTCLPAATPGSPSIFSPLIIILFLPKPSTRDKMLYRMR